jgi:PiT family inorganic phosphate transporter
VLVKDVGDQVQKYGSLNKVPAEVVGNTRNDMYLTSEAIRFLMKDKENDLNKEEVGILNAYKASLDSATKFIPTWVKIAVAIALGLGTMIGWKRIVITVGEKIGKSHLPMPRSLRRAGCRCAIGAADMFDCRSSTTHVLSSGVAGAMAANGSGFTVATIRNMVMAWVLTLPVAISALRCPVFHLRPCVLRHGIETAAPILAAMRSEKARATSREPFACARRGQPA